MKSFNTIISFYTSDTFMSCNTDENLQDYFHLKCYVKFSSNFIQLPLLVYFVNL